MNFEVTHSQKVKPLPPAATFNASPPAASPPRTMALITGASGGIGRALAAECARAGYGVILVACSADKLQALAGELSLALAEELHPQGVTVTALCPGPTQTGFFDHARMHQSALVKGQRRPTPQAVAAAGFAAMQRGDLIEVHGWRNRLMAFGARLAPIRLLLGIARRTSAPRRG